MQKCAPLPPKARCGLGLRRMLNSKGARTRPRRSWPNCRTGRHAGPSRIVTPPISVSANAVRWKQCTGVAQRMISSTAVSGRSRLNSSHWSGFSKNAFMPCVMALRVVSLPATASRMTKNANSTSPMRFAVDVGLDQPGDDVVGRTAPALLGHVVGVAHQLGVGGRRIGVEIRIVGVHDRVGPVEELLAVGLGHADQVGDGQQRQAHRDVVDEVAAALLLRRARRSRGRRRRASPRARRPSAG